MSAAAFAEHCGVKYPTLVSWIAKEKLTASVNPQSKSEDTQQFIIAEFSSHRMDAALKLELPSGVIVHLSSASQLGLLSDLLKTLN